MRISWFFGFGWTSVLIVAACGVGIHLLNGPAVWVLYVPFLLAAIRMTARFRLYSTQPWRRAHHRAMIAFGELAGAEYDAAKRDGREYDIALPCAGLAARLFGKDDAEISGLLLDENRKKYYKGLAREFPQVFLAGIAQERREAVLSGIDRDIDASKLGPDIVIAKAIEMKHSRHEAANYLRALMLGKVG
ncbi:MAG: hypothetical protein LBU46_06360 [Candidatus Accumulibacter sp.]|jgi:hypothetical protein|nr:hypothetical protein [Accumulibacter sp.]